MNGIHKKLLLLVAAISLLLPVNDLRSAITDSTEIPDQQITVFTQLHNVVSQADIARIKEEVRKALNNIPPILGITYKKNIQIEIVDTGICHTKEDIVLVPILHVRDRSAAIIHEVTHIIANHENNGFFSEGLAVYFQERFGEFRVFPNYSVPLDDSVRNHQARLLQITKLKNDNKVFGQIGTEQRRMAYLEAGSFINFLVVKYGEQKLAELHNSSSLNYKEVYGIGINELAAEWKSYVLGNSLTKE